VQANTQYIPHSSTNAFSKLVLDYLNEADSLKPFYTAYPNIDNIQQQVASRSFGEPQRAVLNKVLQAQYTHYIIKPAVQQNISLLLQPNTFTICTAHQPLVFTGTLYFFYKIIHAIKLANTCKQYMPQYNFVPIFYMGTEDADVDEIGSFNFNNKPYKWDPQQTGAVGRMDTASLQLLLNDIKNDLPNIPEQGIDIYALLSDALQHCTTLADVTKYIVHELLGDYGIVVLNPDDAELKQSFVPVLNNELLHQSSHFEVSKTNIDLEKLYKAQAQSRPINLFYLHNNIRERIELKQNIYYVHNTNLQFTEHEILSLASEHPERFSPNVILRGVFQEGILPNIAFVGGGGELAYWMQLKQVFALHNVPMPILVLRQSFAMVSASFNTHLSKLNATITEAFTAAEQWQQQLLKQHELNKILNDHLNDAQLIYNQIANISQIVNKPLQQSTQAHITKISKIHHRLEQKFMAHLKRQDDLYIKYITAIKAELMPHGVLQERYDIALNYLGFYGHNWLNAVYEATLPFGNQYAVMHF
jgi:bacillithiol synthase